MKNLFEALKSFWMNIDPQYGTAEFIYPVSTGKKSVILQEGLDNIKKISEIVDQFFPGMSPKLVWTENGGIAITPIVLEVIGKNKDLNEAMAKKIGQAATKKAFIGNFGFVVNGYKKDGGYIDTYVIEWDKIPEPQKPQAQTKKPQPQQQTS